MVKMHPFLKKGVVMIKNPQIVRDLRSLHPVIVIKRGANLFFTRLLGLRPEKFLASGGVVTHFAFVSVSQRAKQLFSVSIQTAKYPTLDTAILETTTLPPSFSTLAAYSSIEGTSM